LADDPYRGLSAEELRKELAAIRGQLPGMRAEAAAINKELASGKTTMDSLARKGREGAYIGAAADPASKAKAARASGLSADAYMKEARAAGELNKRLIQQEQLQRRLQSEIQRGTAVGREQSTLNRLGVVDNQIRSLRRQAVAVRGLTEVSWERGSIADPEPAAQNVARERSSIERQYGESLAERERLTRLVARSESDLAKAQDERLFTQGRLRNFPDDPQAQFEANEAQKRVQQLTGRLSGRREALDIEENRSKVLQQQTAQIIAREKAMIGAHRAQQAFNQSLTQQQRLLGPYRPGQLPVPYIGGGAIAGTGRPTDFGGQRLLPPGAPPPRQIGPGGQRLLNPPGANIGGTLYNEARRASEGMRDLHTATNQVASAQLRQSRATRVQASGFQRSSAIMAAGSNDMRKFGALTTEFISAAGRGAVTVRELGFQVSSTIGKFGGWLIAGSAVYTAFGAISALGRGAIDAESGVSQLSRVVENLNADQATSSFRDLAGEFNLPIGEVTAASFEMAKVFGDQNQALEATRTILASVKVGELDVATSSRYLTAIIQGFNLPASQMASVFDQINQAQNLFAIRIEDSLAGLAKASGTFRAAGGDINSLLALITTARRATGQTGEVIGTALARAPNFLRQANNQDVLRQFGIDATAPIDDVINQAFDRAQTLSGERLQQLASAIFGPQYGARIGTPLLQNMELYKQVLADTSPEASAGSAQRELASVLAQVSEQIQSIITSLEILGSNLADAGFFAPFFLLIDGLNMALDAANALLGIFNQLPRPLRLAVSFMTQFAGAVALARRFNIGQSLGTGRASSFLTRRNQDQFLYKEALRQQQSVLTRELDSAGQSAVRKSLAVETAQRTYDTEYRAASALAAQRGQALKDLGDAEREGLTRASQQLNTAKLAELDAQQHAKTIVAEQIHVQDQLTAMRRKLSDTEFRALQQTYGVIPQTRVGPNLVDQQLATQVRREYGLPAGALDVEPGRRGPIDTPTMRDEALRPSTLRSRMANLTNSIAHFGLVGGVVREGTETAREAAARTRLAMGRIDRASIGRIGSNFKAGAARFASGLLSFIGPIDAAIAGILILVSAFTKSFSQVSEVEQIKAMETPDLASYNDKVSQLTDKADDSFNIVTRIGEEIFGIDSAPTRAIDELDQITADRNQQLQTLIAGRVPQRSNYLYAEDYESVFSQIRENQRAGENGTARLIHGTRRFIRQVRQAETLSIQQQQQMIADAKVLRVEGLGSDAGYSQVATIAGEDLSEQISQLAEGVTGGLGTLRDQRLLIRDTLVQGAEALRSGSLEDRIIAAQDFSTMADALSEAAQAELDRALLFANSQSERNAAYDAYAEATDPAIIRRESRKLIAGQRQQISRNRRAIQSMAAELGGANPLLGLLGGLGRTVAGGTGLSGIGTAIGALERFGRGPFLKEIEERGKANRQIQRVIKSLRESEKEAIKRLREVRRQQALERFSESQDLLSARSELAQSRTQEGLPAIAEALRDVNQRLRRALAQDGVEIQEIIALRNERQGILDEQVQEQLSLIQAQGEYRTAGINPEREGARARSTLAGLRNQLSFMLAHPRQFSANDIIGIQTQIRDAEWELAQQAEEEAEQLRLALYDIRIARAEARGDDVAAARAGLAKALAEMEGADTREERRQARASVIGQRAAVRDAIFNREIEDIEFAADIGKLTLQQQISQYQQLLRTLDTTRDQRRDLRRRIYQLRQEAEQESGEFDLRLGDIKLPTIYEIRRAIQGGINGAPNVQMSQTNNYTAHGANADEIIGQIRGQERDAARRNRNMARSAGLL
jgi:TP901 family phage tail tape measure protein